MYGKLCDVTAEYTPLSQPETEDIDCHSGIFKKRQTPRPSPFKLAVSLTYFLPSLLPLSLALLHLFFPPHSICHHMNLVSLII